MAVNYSMQPYRGNVDLKSHNIFVVVSCTPDVRTDVRKPPKSRVTNGSTDTVKHTSTRPLHFVNTDAGNIGARNSGRGTRDVKSHLSGHYRRWKKQQKLSLQASRDQHEATTEVALISAPAQAGLAESAPTTNYTSSDKSFHSSSCSPSSSSPTSGSSPDRAGSQTDVQQIAGFPRLRNTLSHGNSDPFNAFPLTIDPETNRHIQLFHESTTIMCWTKAVDSRLYNLLHFEATMHGVLAVSKIISAVYLPWHQRSTSLLPDSRQHYGELLRLMRTHFDGQARLDSSLAMEMLHAACMFSFLAREYNGLDLHLKKWKELIEASGGVKNVDQFYSLRFLNAERLRAMFLYRKPLTPAKEWSPASWFEEAQFRPFDQGFERGRQLMSSPNPPLLPPGFFRQKTHDLIMDYRDMLSAGSVAAALFRGKQPGVDQIQRWLNFRSQSLTFKTAAIMTEMDSIRRSQPSLELSLHASTCQAANVISHLIYYSSKPTIGLSFIAFPTFLRDLQEVANYVDKGHQLQHEDLYMWALFVGACAELASRTWSCDPSIRGSSWCSTKLASMMERLGVNTLQDFQNNLRQFLYPVMFFSYAKVLFDRKEELLELAA